MKTINYIIAFSAILFAACESENTETVASNDLTTTLPGEKIVFTKITKHLITDVIECTGRIDVPPNRRAAVYAPIGGVVSSIKILPGDLVKKGQILFKLSHQDIVQMQQDYLQAKNDFKLFKVNFERKQKLFKAESISEREYRMAQHDFNISKASLESSSAQLDLIGISSQMVDSKGISKSIYFRAPINGYISEFFTVSGSYVDINEPILTIVNTDHRHVELDVYADKINQVRVGQLVNFRTAGSAIDHQAEIQVVGKEVHEDTRTVRVHAHLIGELKNELVIGTYLYAGISTSADSVYSLPHSAIVKIDDNDFVLVKDGEGLLSVKVETGQSYKEFVEIKNAEALLDKDIVSKDAYYNIE